MSDRVRCNCPRCTIRGLMGPAVLITLGVLFLFNEMRGGFFSFRNTFPVILIVLGVVSLASTLAPADGHISGSAPPTPPGAAPPRPQNSFPDQSQGF